MFTKITSARLPGVSEPNLRIQSDRPCTLDGGELQQLPGRDRKLVLRPPGLDVLEHLHDGKHVRHTRVEFELIPKPTFIPAVR